MERVSRNLDCSVSSVTSQERDCGHWQAIFQEDHRLLTKWVVITPTEQWLGLAGTHAYCLICLWSFLQCKEEEPKA